MHSYTFDVPYERKETVQARVDSFCPAILHALHTKHLVEDASKEFQDCNPRCFPGQIVTSSLLEYKFSHPIYFGRLHPCAIQVPLKDRFVPAILRDMKHDKIDHNTTI